MSGDIVRPGKAGRWTLPINLLAFVLSAITAFRRNLTDLFFHFDGHYMLVEALNRVPPVQPLLDYSNDFLQSIGNLQFPQNPLLQLYFLPLHWIADPAAARVAVYLCIAVVAFLCSYASARMLGQGRLVAVLAGWIIGVICTPFVPTPFFYPILPVAPFMIMLVAGPVLGFALLRLAGRCGVIGDGYSVIGLMLLTLYFMSASAGLVPILALAAVPYIVIALCAARSRAERTRKLGVLVVVALALLALRVPWYLIGLFKFTAVGIFPADFTAVYSDPIYVSVLFHWTLFGWAGPVLVCVAQLGALLSLRRSERVVRVAALVLVGEFMLLLAFAGVLQVAKNWILPPPIYLEIALWPLYGVFAAVAIVRACSLVAKAWPSFGARVWAEDWVPLPAVAAAALVAFSHPTGTPLPWPPAKGPVIDRLESEAALQPGKRFNGRAATVIPVDRKPDESWGQQFTVSYQSWVKSGNDHMSIGLWYFRIPTLFEYNQFTSPFFHALVKRTLQQPAVPHQRNVLIVSRVNEAVMSLLGVRFLVIPRPDGVPLARSLRELVATDAWSLFELPDANLATYSPTTIEVKRDLAASLDFVADPQSDLVRKAVVVEPFDRPLVAVSSSELTMAGGGLRLVARSDGRSLVIVPLEYSRCLVVRPTDAGGQDARLVRVDGLLTGVVFDKAFDGVIEFRIGPLTNPMCRWRDYQDLVEMLGR